VAVDDRSLEHAEEELVAQVARGTLNVQGAARLERHLADCPTCVAELEAMRVFHVAIAPGADDEVLDGVAVEGALARLAEDKGRLGLAGRPTEDDALDRAAVDRAMAVIGEQDRAKRGQRRWQVTGLAVFGAAAAATLVATVAKWPPATTRPVGVAVAARPLVLADGSEVLPEAPATPVQVREQTAARTVVRLSSGAARFRVKHDARRLFRVDAGPIQIEDLGTVFRVAHQQGGGVRVVVSEGRVAVLSPADGTRVELAAGDERVFFAPPGILRSPLAGAAPSAATETTPAARPGLGAAAPSPAPSSAPAPVAAPVPPAAGQTPIRGQPRAHAEEDPAELLAAADVARRSRDPRAAVAPLRRLVQRHPKDPRAPSAAFTLGWVLLTDLDRPREAAGAFADAERLAPRGALAEDAAARIAEAWQSAGESRRAAEAARRYEQMYPTGRYVGLMHGLMGKHAGKN